jgi:hypothetical protein
MKLGKYISEHWRGNQSLARSCLVNGVLLGIAAYMAVAIMGAVIGRGYISWCRSHTDYCAGHMMDFVFYIAFPFRTFPRAIWAVWATVGMFRCGVRNWVHSSAAKARLSGGGAVIAAVILAVWMGDAIASFVRGERYLIEAEACQRDDRTGSSPQCAAYRVDTEEMLKEVEARMVKKGQACEGDPNPAKCAADNQKRLQGLREEERRISEQGDAR